MPDKKPEIANQAPIAASSSCFQMSSSPDDDVELLDGACLAGSDRELSTNASLIYHTHLKLL